MFSIPFTFCFNKHILIVIILSRQCSNAIRDSPLPFPLHYSHYVLGNVIANGVVLERFGLAHNIAAKLLAAAANMQAIA